MFVVLADSAAAQSTAIKAGRVVAPAGRVLTNAVIVVENDRIAAVTTGVPPSASTVIDLGRYTIIPGMIDAHTHMTYFWDGAPGHATAGRQPAGVGVDGPRAGEPAQDARDGRDDCSRHERVGVHGRRDAGS